MMLHDFQGKTIRLTSERLEHIREHPEMALHASKIHETLSGPDIVAMSLSDPEAHLYYKRFQNLSIGDKYLCVVVKFKEADAFVVTAYFTDGIKKGEVLWKR